MGRENTGCFAWFVSFRETCNERWAKFRNRFRRRFYTSRRQEVDQSTILNETGTPDTVLSKIPYRANKVAPFSMARTTITVPDAHVVPTTKDPFDTLVEEYISGIITKARDILLFERKQASCSTGVLKADDSVSLTSSVISEIAEIAVTESLSNVVLESDKNESAARVTSKPKTIKEFMEIFGVADGEADDGLPPVDF